MKRSALVWLLAVPTLLPAGAALLALAQPYSRHWPHLLQQVLPDAAWHTAVLMLCVSLGAGLIGTTLAWLTARYRFPAHGLLHAALLTPLALPGYVLGFVTIAALDYAGPVQAAWRQFSGSHEALWQIRGLGGAALVLSLTLYPYVYLIARNAFVSIAAANLEVAASLGRRRVMRDVALPLARPWIAGGILLVSMEVLADFGTVALFNVPTFTTSIYKSWYGLFSLGTALQLASLLVLLALGLMLLHARVQGDQRRMQQDGGELPQIQLRGLPAYLLSGGLALFVGLVVALPLGTLGLWSWQHLSQELDPRYLRWLGHSLQLALGSALVLLAAAQAIAYVQRRQTGPAIRWGVRAATLGYALPGTLLAVGLYAPLAGLEQALNPWLTPGWLTQSLLLLLLGYWARFMTVAHTPLAQQLSRLPPSLDDVSRSLGVSGLRLIGRVHLPLIRGALATTLALLTIDIIKEMPITLMLRPTGWDTLATRVFELTAEGEYRRAALPALSIVLAGFLPVALLLRLGRPRALLSRPHVA